MRSKIYKKIFLFSLIVLVLLISSAYVLGFQSKNKSIKLEKSNQDPAQNIIDQRVISENEISQNKDTDSLDENLIQVSLKVQDKKYNTKIEEGSSVYDLMNQLKNQGFNFSATEYSSLGFFITEINGLKEDRKNATYWTLYLNDKEASVGASQLILTAGDLIEWKHEKKNNY
jgi:hypothetical protein